MPRERVFQQSLNILERFLAAYSAPSLAISVHVNNSSVSVNLSICMAITGHTECSSRSMSGD